MGKKEKGITLISLVLTIIVMLILVAVSINVAINGGLFKKAGEAVKKTDISKLMEDWMVTKWANFDSETLSTSIPDGELPQELKNKYPQFANDFFIENGELMYVGTNLETKQYVEDLGIVVGTRPLYNAAKGCNAPKLMEGMTPIKIGTDGTVSTTTADDETWYNYTDKQWANAKTLDGSYWVWIPRFAYMIPGDEQHTSGYHSSAAVSIQIKFLKNKTNKSSDGTTSWDNESGASKWNIHPAFNFGGPIEGFWVAKFEASNSDGNIKVVPGVTSWRAITVNDIFNKCKNAKYGGTVDLGSHLMKNSEWGAVAYLAQSQYGKNSEVWINPNGSYITGQAGTGASVGATTTTDAYYTGNGPQASTTGNVTGIYDMSGGACEYVAAYVANENSSLNNGTSLLNETEAKYKDVYQPGSSDDGTLNYTANSLKYGDAIYETSSSGGTWKESGNAWYRDCSGFSFGKFPFFRARGADF